MITAPVHSNTTPNQPIQIRNTHDTIQQIELDIVRLSEGVDSPRSFNCSKSNVMRVLSSKLEDLSGSIDERRDGHKILSYLLILETLRTISSNDCKEIRMKLLGACFLAGFVPPMNSLAWTLPQIHSQGESQQPASRASISESSFILPSVGSRVLALVGNEKREYGTVIVRNKASGQDSPKWK